MYEHYDIIYKLVSEQQIFWKDCIQNYLLFLKILVSSLSFFVISLIIVIMSTSFIIFSNNFNLHFIKENNNCNINKVIYLGKTFLCFLSILNIKYINGNTVSALMLYWDYLLIEIITHLKIVYENQAIRFIDQERRKSFMLACKRKNRRTRMFVWIGRIPAWCLREKSEVLSYYHLNARQLECI